MNAPNESRAELGGTVVVRRWEKLFWLAVGGGLLALLWSMLCTVPGIPWNAARLAPSFALARGLPIYALRDSGAHLGWFYGPVFPLWFWPLSWVENPTVGLALVAGWNALTIILPVFFVVRAALGGRVSVAGRATLIGVVLMLAHPTTQSAFYMVHVDAVCVACVLAACVALHARVLSGWKPGLPVAAVAVALAIATKQLAVVFVPASLVWLWREGHGRLVQAWLFWLVVCGGSLAGIFLAAFGAEELLFNVWLIHSRNAWQGGGAWLGARFVELMVTGWVWWVVIAVVALAVRPWERATLRPTAGAMVRLLGWAALWQLPLGLLATLKAGGGLNSVHALSYALVAGLIVLGAALARHDAEVTSGRKNLRMAWSMGAAVLLALVVDFRMAVGRPVVWTPYRGLEELVAESKAYPGKRYYPWNPLITILSERKIYPFDDALKCLWIAQLEPPAEVIRAAIPSGAVIVYHEPSQSKFVLNYLGPEARQAANPRREP